MPDPITTPSGRVVAPGGWRRGVTGVVVGMAAGVVLALAVHRDSRLADRGSGQVGS